MMTREEIAKQINANIKGISRIIQVNYELDEYVEGQEFIQEHNASWTDGGEFTVENPAEYTYVFVCVNECPVHVVDYDNEDEVYELGAENCEKEKEVLVPDGTKFKVLSVGTMAGMEEMGFVTIEVEYIK